MNEALALDPTTIPVLKPARQPPRRPELQVGQIWHVKFPGEISLTCVQIDELTHKTVALRKQSDLAAMYSPAEPAVRYDRRDIKFVEQAPE